MRLPLPSLPSHLPAPAADRERERERARGDAPLLLLLLLALLLDERARGNGTAWLAHSTLETCRAAISPRSWYRQAGVRYGSRVLDAGCGAGYCSMELAEIVCAIDGSTQALDQFREQATGVGGWAPMARCEDVEGERLGHPTLGELRLLQADLLHERPGGVIARGEARLGGRGPHTHAHKHHHWQHSTCWNATQRSGAPTQVTVSACGRGLRRATRTGSPP